MTSIGASTALDRALLQWSVEQFYFHEAALLDERRYNDWIALFSKDVRYWAPVRMTREGASDIGAEGELGLFDDDYGTLELRVESLQVKSAWAEIPPSRTRRLVCNVQVTPLEGDYVSATSNLFVFRSRLESVEHMFLARRIDRLERLGEDNWRVCERTILLDHSSFRTDNITLLF